MVYSQNKKSQHILRLGTTLPLFFFIFYAFWTIFCHLAVVFALPYSMLSLFFCITLGSSAFIYVGCSQILLNDASDLSTASDHTGVDTISCLFLVVLAIVLLPIMKSLNYLWLWVGMVFALIGIYLKIKVSRNEPIYHSNADLSASLTLIGLVICTVVVISISVFSMRYDADDSFYLSVVVQALESPHLPTLYYESLNGLTDTLMPIKRRVCTYELLVAAFANLSKLDHLTVYYVVFPIISCIVFIGLFFSIYKRILETNKAAIVAIVALVIILLCWGDGHRTYGNFSFVRLFQGKSLLIQIFVPGAVYFAIQSFVNRRIIYLIILCFILVGASGVSVNGVLIAPLAVLFVFLGFLLVYPRQISNFSNYARIAVVLFYPLLVALVVKTNPGGEFIKYFGSPKFPERFSDSYQVLGTVIGNMSQEQSFNFKTIFILASFLTMPLFIPKDKHQNMYLGFIVMTVFILFFPGYPFQRFIAEHASRNMMWRLTWAIPFVFFAACSIGAIMNSKKKKQIFLVPVLLLFFIMAEGSWTVSKDNKTQWSIQSHKFSPSIVRELRDLRPLLPPDGLLIAPEWLTVVMSSLVDFPPLPIVRKMYLGREEEVKKRELKIVSYGVRSYLDKDDVQKFWDILVKRDICSIILYRPQKIEPELKKLLLKNNFEMRKVFKGHTLWVDVKCDTKML